MAGPELYKVGRSLGGTDAGGSELTSGMEASGTSRAEKLGRGMSENLSSLAKTYLFYL